MSESNDELTVFARKILEQQPFSVLLGTRLESITPGKVELRLALRRELQQQHGFAHGGVVSYLADNAITFAGGSVLRDSVTAEYKINYVRPAIGEELIARAEVASNGQRQAVCRCEIYASRNGELKLCAVALGTIARAEPRG